MKKAESFITTALFFLFTIQSINQVNISAFKPDHLLFQFTFSQTIFRMFRFDPNAYICKKQTRQKEFQSPKIRLYLFIQSLFQYLVISLIEYDILNKSQMPRNKDSSDSRQRSRSKNKRYRKSSSRSHSSRRKSSRYEKKEKEYYTKSNIPTTKTRSDIKNHIVYEHIRRRYKNDEELIMDQVKKILKDQFGPVQHVTKIQGDSDEEEFSFAVGFKYDKDALRLINEGGFINSTIDKTNKLVGKPTMVFEQCIPMIKQQIKQAKKLEKKARSPENRKHYRRSSSSEKDKKKRHSSPRGKSHDKRQSKKQYKSEERSVWIFGLPWSIKGKQIQSYLSDHTSGPFPVMKWRWVRVKNSNCEFMEITLDEKKAHKLLGLREEQQIEGCPYIIAPASTSSQNQEIIKDILKDYQFKVTFPERINPSSLYKALNDSARVVQIVSCQKLVDGRSDSFIVTLGSSSKAKDVKRLGFLPSSGIRVEEFKGQLVFRPTKHSKLIDSQH